jgi:hypothetical protein
MHPVNRKTGLVKGRLNDVLVGEWSWEIINCLLKVLKNDFCEVDEAIYQGVERPYEHIFCILCSEKSVSDEVACCFK